MVSRFIVQEIAEGRGINGKDYVYLSVAHLGKEMIDAKLPDITDFARNYLNVEPYYEPIPIQPTAHYAMGGIPTDIEGRVVMDETEDRAAGSLRRRRGGLCLGARRQPTGHQLAGRSDRLRQARRQAYRQPSGYPRPSSPRCRRTRTPMPPSWLRDCWRVRGGEAKSRGDTGANPPGAARRDDG